MRKALPALLLCLVILIVGGCASAPSVVHSGKRIPATFTDAMFMDAWYGKFVKRYHREPVLEVVVLKPPGVVYDTYRNDPSQKEFINGFPEGFRKGIITSGKAILVSRATREIDSLERYFEMEHAASDSIAEPGHVKGADFVLAFQPEETPITRYLNPGPVRPFFDGLTAFISEIFFYPIWGDMFAITFKTTITLHLIDLRTDEDVWWAQKILSYNTPIGFTSYSEVSNPGVPPISSRFVSGKWVPIH